MDKDRFGVARSKRIRLSLSPRHLHRRVGGDLWTRIRKLAGCSKQDTSTMTRQVQPDVARPFITVAEPQLFVADVRTSCDFFIQNLGFTIAFVYGDPPFFGQVTRDGARLNLKSFQAPFIDGSKGSRGTVIRDDDRRDDG